jgi:hypothetical protein
MKAGLLLFSSQLKEIFVYCRCCFVGRVRHRFRHLLLHEVMLEPLNRGVRVIQIDNIRNNNTQNDDFFFIVVVA